MKRILLINAVCGTGSTGRIVADLWKTLKNKGCEAKVAFGIGEGLLVDKQDQFKFNNKWGYYLHNAISRITDRAGFYSNIPTLRLLRFMDQYKPDLIHLHNLHGYYVNIRLLFDYIKQHDIPVVWTLHDCWAFTGHCTHFDFVGCDRWHTKCFDCPQKKEYPQSLVLDQSARNFRQKKELFTSLNKISIVTPSKWLADCVKQSFLSKYDITTIPNGIDLEVFRPVESDIKNRLSIPDHKKIVLAVANVWDKRKGFSDVIRLSQLLPENAYQIVMVGLTEAQISSLPKNIIGIKRTKNINELVELYSAAFMFFNPTYEDNFPTTNIEALACGTPVITYMTGGSLEAIDEKTGFAVGKGDLSKVLNIITNPNIDGNACRQRSESRFNKSEMYFQYLKIYRLLM